MIRLYVWNEQQRDFETYSFEDESEIPKKVAAAMLAGYEPFSIDLDAPEEPPKAEARWKAAWRADREVRADDGYDNIPLVDELIVRGLETYAYPNRWDRPGRVVQPKKKQPEVPPEVWQTKPVDPDRAWDAVMAMCGGTK